jgi:hypothetical protein
VQFGALAQTFRTVRLAVPTTSFQLQAAGSSRTAAVHPRRAAALMDVPFPDCLRGIVIWLSLAIAGTVAFSGGRVTV